MISFQFQQGFGLFRAILLLMATLRPRRTHFWACMYTPPEQPADNSSPEPPADHSTPVISFMATDTARCQVRFNFTTPCLVSTLPHRCLMIDFAQFCSHFGNVCGVPDDISFSCDENQLYAELTFDNDSGRYRGGSQFTVSQLNLSPEIVDPKLDFNWMLSGEASPRLLADALMALPRGPEVSLVLEVDEARFFGDEFLSSVPLTGFENDFDGDLPFEMRIGFYRTSRNAVIALLRQVARVWICASYSGQCSFQCLLPDGHGCVKVTFYTSCVLEH